MPETTPPTTHPSEPNPGWLSRIGAAIPHLGYLPVGAAVVVAISQPSLATAALVFSLLWTLIALNAFRYQPKSAFVRQHLQQARYYHRAGVVSAASVAVVACYVAIFTWGLGALVALCIAPPALLVWMMPTWTASIRALRGLPCDYQAESPPAPPPEEEGAGRLWRGIVGGYFASSAMLFVLMGSYAGAMLVAASRLQWATRLTENTLTMAVQSSFYEAVGIHYMAGALFALAYVYWYEPKVLGPDWQKGILYSMGLCFLSLFVFFPAVGAGLCGLNLGAGPLPIVGNILLHSIYGLTLGLTNGYLKRLQERKINPATEVVLGSAEGAALGIFGGSILGLILAQFSLWGLEAGGGLGGSLPVSWALSSGALAGSALGCLVGLVIGHRTAGRTGIPTPG